MKKGVNMLNITIEDKDIQNSKIKQILETMTQKEIKDIFMNFLESKLNNTDKWDKLVNDIEKLKISNVSDEIIKTSKEFRNSFNLREVN